MSNKMHLAVLGDLFKEQTTPEDLKEVVRETLVHFKDLIKDQKFFYQYTYSEGTSMMFTAVSGRTESLAGAHRSRTKNEWRLYINGEYLTTGYNEVDAIGKIVETLEAKGWIYLGARGPN